MRQNSKKKIYTNVNSLDYVHVNNRAYFISKWDQNDIHMYCEFALWRKSMNSENKVNTTTN